MSGIWTLVRASLWRRRARAFALLVGVALATACFAVLTGTTRTGRLEARGAVARNFRSTYDIVVRPAGGRTPLELRQELVAPAALSGVFGGISAGQWRTILGLPGIEVAAPIAIVGYALPSVTVPLDLTADLRGDHSAFRIGVERVTDRGRSRARDASQYVYVTRRALRRERGRDTSNAEDFAPREVLTDGGERPICVSEYQSIAPQGPFDFAVRGGERDGILCWSLRTGLFGEGFRSLREGHVGALLPASVPFVVAAIDPDQEARLEGLDRAVVAGRYLRAGDRPSGDFLPRVPVLVASRPTADEDIVATVERLGSAATRALRGAKRGAALRAALQRAPATILRTVRLTSRDSYGALLEALAGRARFAPVVTDFWTLGARRLHRMADGTLTAKPVRNTKDAWASDADGGYAQAPLSAADVQFAPLHGNVGAASAQIGEVFPALRAVGRFDPAHIRDAHDPLSTYRLPSLQPADQSSRAALGGKPLLPNANIAGPIDQPPLLLTTLASVRAFASPNFSPGVARAPISAIRVRVAGVRGIDALSRERVRLAADRIRRVTGLDVDLTVGASSAPQRVALPAGRHGRPPLTLAAAWTKKGVGLAILSAVDRKSLLLFALILVVCALFVTNATAAATAARRTELGVLSALGWPPARVCLALLSEALVVGGAAGLLGAALAIVGSRALGIATPLVNAALAAPAAVASCLAATAATTLRAARTSPMTAIRPAVATGRRGIVPAGTVTLALSNARRTPLRTGLGALSLAVGVLAITVVLGLTFQFRGALAGTVLGQVVSVQVRSADLIAAWTTVALGGVAVADLLFLNMRERAAELATLRALGWPDGRVAVLVVSEAVAIGLLGAIPGALLGLLLTTTLAGGVGVWLAVAAAASIVAGAAVAACGGLLAATAVRRQATTALLAQE